MPEHTSFFTYLVHMFPALGENMKNLGPTLFGKEAGPQTAEPLVGMVFIIVLIAGLAFATRAKITNYDEAVKPDAHLSLRTFFEILIGYFYDMMKDMMGPARAKRYFPIVGTAAVFILVANFLGMVPGFPLITSTWSVTAGCAAVVFIAFNYYGIKENGAGYFKHLAGPVWWLAPLIFPLEVFSLCLRPMTLSVRLMLNMSVDHLLLAIALGALALVLPIPVMVLGTLVAIVQVLVFCLLSSIYIALATEHEEHGEGHGHAHGKKHHDEAHAH